MENRNRMVPVEVLRGQMKSYEESTSTCLKVIAGCEKEIARLNELIGQHKALVSTYANDIKMLQGQIDKQIEYGQEKQSGEEKV